MADVGLEPVSGDPFAAGGALDQQQPSPYSLAGMNAAGPLGVQPQGHDTIAPYTPDLTERITDWMRGNAPAGSERATVAGKLGATLDLTTPVGAVSQMQDAAARHDPQAFSLAMLGALPGAGALDRGAGKVAGAVAREAPIVQFRRDAESINQALPPAPDGFTRLWRGNRVGEVGQATAFTNDLPGIALPFRKAYGGDLSYVDVPTTAVGSFENKAGTATGAEFNLPSDLASQAKIAPASGGMQAAGAVNAVPVSGDPFAGATPQITAYHGSPHDFVIER